jgi:hypothetical protein
MPWLPLAVLLGALAGQNPFVNPAMASLFSTAQHRNGAAL